MTIVLVAPDSFKSTMDAHVVTAAIAAGVESVGAFALRCPLADGGEGTGQILAAALQAHRVDTATTDPLGRPHRGWFWLTPDGQTAIVDTATASGLHTVTADDRDPETASSAGTGILLAAAAAAGARKLYLGVGGSATTDGGRGALAAIIAAGGLRGARLTVLCDVQTPFEDAAQLYAPQKGADPAAITRLSQRLHTYADSLPRDPRARAATGAAGGLSGALWSTYDADLVSGIDTVCEIVGLPEQITAVDLVLTGEGRLDDQTLQGKVVSGVARCATAAGVPVYALVGQNRATAATVNRLGLAGVREAGTPPALQQAAVEITRRHLPSAGDAPHPLNRKAPRHVS